MPAIAGYRRDLTSSSRVASGCLFLTRGGKFIIAAVSFAQDLLFFTCPARISPTFEQGRYDVSRISFRIIGGFFLNVIRLILAVDWWTMYAIGDLRQWSDPSDGCARAFGGWEERAEDEGARKSKE